MGQEGVLQQTEEITHFLRADIRDWVSRGLATKRKDHAHTEGRHQPVMGQQGVLQQTDEITHKLRADINQEWVSRGSCSRQRRSRTS
jgi:hypothetical protein